jgi:hypothetical protein
MAQVSGEYTFDSFEVIYKKYKERSNFKRKA